jgi:hypothetical protein
LGSGVRVPVSVMLGAAVSWLSGVYCPLLSAAATSISLKVEPGG